ncbi:spore coat protein U domain-containing protein [Acidovorax sp. Root217]|uniref:spore coat protein U domain-containing protein n=1 Tax=Acidovorax sp. Root217 TaxID=1736492 RepID=UPI0009E829FA|nr:spore coat protein U domain-containing protein [Acidovorax sp. Root217]
MVQEMHARAGRGSRARSQASPQVAIVLPLLCTSLAAMAATAPTSPSFAVNASVVSGCIVSGNSSQVTGVPFGSVNFGTHSAVSTGTVTAMASNDMGMQAQLVCTAGTAAQVSVNGGLNLQGAQRRLSNGAGQFIPYTLSLVAGTVTALAPNVAVGITMGTTPTALPIRGNLVLPGSAAMAGTYVDTVLVTVTW